MAPWEQRTSSASISRPGDRVGPGVVGEHEVVVALVAVGLLGVPVDLDHSSPDEARFVLQGPFVEQIAVAMRAAWCWSVW